MRWLRPRRASAYEHLSDIASGGVGRVELVRRREGSFERLYARKRLHDAHRDDADFRTMFFDEARIAGLVRHPNVVSVLDVGEDDEGPYLVMEYVEGVPASAIVQQAIARRAEVPLQLALRIGIEAALGLHAAHELTGPSGEPLALVHRDVSPQNILVGFDGVTRVTDFGVAKAFGRTTRTATGVLKGKLGYMAPEQLRFEEVDRRADLFSLGIVLYELLARRRLYRNVDGHDGVRRILHEAPPDLGDVRADAAPELVELVFSMLAKDPARRPRTALDVARVLEDVLTDAIAQEGRLDIGEHLREIFADELARQRERSRAPARVAISRGRRTALTASIVAGVIAAVVSVWASLTPDEHAEAPPMPPPVAAPPIAAPAPQPEPVIEATPPAAHDASETDVVTPGAPAPRARRAARASRRPASESRTKIPMWEWE
ncbi:Serine/threonine protein kinase PrkC, regulator of stationary phase [Sandaracinus amylolyticus]|nr:Serine/threonine protein kinase PrkC, regulator of stationary phase [Sandaracinus amylolyticus]